MPLTIERVSLEPDMHRVFINLLENIVQKLHDKKYLYPRFTIHRDGSGGIYYDIPGSNKEFRLFLFGTYSYWPDEYLILTKKMETI